MYLKKLSIRNFRRLNSVVIDLASDISIFVGANNSGKTSVGTRFNYSLATAASLFMILVPRCGDGSSLSAREWIMRRCRRLRLIFGSRLVPTTSIASSTSCRASVESSLVGMRVVFAPIDAEATRTRFLKLVSVLLLPSLRKRAIKRQCSIHHLAICKSICVML